MKNVERLKIHNEGMKIHKISIENTFSYCILVSLGAPPAVVPQTHAFCSSNRPSIRPRPRPNSAIFWKSASAKLWPSWPIL